MPIRINLLAEAQAAEEMRRRDLVKRALWGAALVVFGVLAWAGSMQMKVMRAKSELSAEESKWSGLEKKYQAVTDNYKQAGEIERKLAALSRLSTNRFLWGNTLNALQQTTVDQVTVTRLKTEQMYTTVEGVPAKPGATGAAAVSKPASATEKITIAIEGRDYSATTDRNYNKFKSAIAAFPYFQSYMPRADAIKLNSLSPPATDPADPGKSFVNFTLECEFPGIRRDE